MLEPVYVKHVMRGCIYYTAVVSNKVYKDPVKPGFHRKKTRELVLALVVATVLLTCFSHYL